MRTRDGSLKLFPLFDASMFTNKPLDSVRTKNNWIGAIYYKLIQTSWQGRNYYTLLGFDGFTVSSNRKWMDVLSFDQNTGEPAFGGPYFLVYSDSSKKAKVQYRFNIEYKKEASTTFNYNLATRYKLTDHVNLRGSFSTGFRAPSLQQINFSSTFTTVQGADIKEVKIAPNYSPITAAAGIEALKQEKSLNASLGFTAKLSKAFTLTVGGYMVNVKDRVVLSGQFSADDERLDPALNDSMKTLEVALAQFFANAVNTSNRCIEMVLGYNKKNQQQQFKALLTGNIQSMDIDKINVPAKLNGTADLRATFLTEREQKFILASAPNAKFGLTLEHNWTKFGVGLRLTYFGETPLLGFGDGTAEDFNPPF